MTGSVYFARIGDDGPIKIGFTAGIAEVRIADLQTACPWKITLVGSVDGFRHQEIFLHARLADFRMEGEWFRPDLAVLDTVDLVLSGRFNWAGLTYVDRSAGLAKAINAAGSAAKLARGLNITAQALSQWNEVPPLRVIEVERIAGIPRHELRPDMYPPSATPVEAHA